MKVSTKQKSLSKALGIVARAVSSRSTMPILANILLEAKDNQLRLSATNREISISCWIAAEIADEGATTVPARLLGEFVNSLPNEPVTMELKVRTETLALKCARFDANIKGINALDFPTIPTDIGGTKYNMPPDMLAVLIDSVAFAASDDENRPTLTGIQVAFAAGIRMAATDGYRLGERSAALCESSDKTSPQSVVIAAKSLAEVARVANDAADVSISVSQNHALFSMTGEDDWTRVDILTSLIDAKFPEYATLIPKTHNMRCVVDRNALLRIVRVALLFARDNNNQIHAEFSNGKITVTATSPELGDNVSEIDGDVSGAPLTIGLNAKYIIDALQHVDTSEVVLEATTDTRPLVMKPATGSGYVVVIMPMQKPK